MLQNMKEWLKAQASSSVKKAMPLLSFPAINRLGCNVKEIATSSSLQAEAMKYIANALNTLASVSFMDLSVEAECFGAEICFNENEVPNVLGSIVCDDDSAEALIVPTVGTARSGIYIDAIKKATELITDRPIFAGIIGPYSLAARLMDVTEIMMCCYDEPEIVHTVLEKCTSFLIKYAKSYKSAGAGGIIMAEPVTGLLSPDLAEEFSEPYVKRIVDAVSDDNFIVIYHNCGDRVPFLLDSILRTGADAYHFGNAVDIKSVLEQMPTDAVIMGNIDPVGDLVNGTPESVAVHTRELLDNCGMHSNFIPSSGCDIPPNAKWENIVAFIEAVDEFYK